MRIYLLLMFSINLMYGVATEKIEIKDFGIDGHMYDIVEENMMKTIKDKTDNFKITKKQMRKILKNEMEKQAVGTTNLPFGKEKKEYSEKNFQVLQQDVFNPLGRIYKKKGEKVYINSPKPLDICFIDGSNPILLKNQIKYFDKLVTKTNSIRCIYMVSNKSVLDLNTEYYPRIFYPANKAYEERFMVKSIPTYIHIEKDRKYFYSYPIEMFKHEVKLK